MINLNVGQLLTDFQKQAIPLDLGVQFDKLVLKQY